MILKKPYAFFIKNFKLFHLIIFILSAILLYRTSLIYDFLREYNKTNPNVIGNELTSPLFSTWLYILIIIILAVNIIIIWILIKKEKPYMYYIMNISLYIAVLCIYIIDNGIIGNMEKVVLAAKTTLAIRDITNIARLLQTVSVIFYLIRATGFDIKKFDFVRDLQGLDISEEDSEEIEVSLEFEKNVFIRKVKKHIRDAIYYYKENRFVLNVIMVCFLMIIIFLIYLGTNKYDKLYRENQFIPTKLINIGVKETTVVTKDYKNKKIVADDKAIVAVKVSVKGTEFQTSRMALSVNGTQYYHTNGYETSLSDLGTVYTNQKITKEFEDYILVYVIPSNLIKSEMTFKYIDNMDYKRGETTIDSIDIRLNPKYPENKKEVITQYQLNNEIEINDYKININSYEISDKFENTYRSCVNSNECYDFKEVLLPVLSDRAKALIKIEGTIESETNSIKNLGNFIEKYANVEYILNGNTYETTDLYEVSAVKTGQKNIYYIEVDKEALYSDNIKLTFNIRNNKYKYILRGETNE